MESFLLTKRTGWDMNDKHAVRRKQSLLFAQHNEKQSFSFKSSGYKEFSGYSVHSNCQSSIIFRSLERDNKTGHSDWQAIISDSHLQNAFGSTVLDKGDQSRVDCQKSVSPFLLYWLYLLLTVRSRNDLWLVRHTGVSQTDAHTLVCHTLTQASEKVCLTVFWRSSLEMIYD